MNVGTTSLDVRRFRDDGEMVVCKALVREPERDANGHIKIGKDGHFEFEKKSRLRTRMLKSYLKNDIVAFIPRELVAEVRDEFLRYAEDFPLWKEPAFTAVMSDVTGTFYDLETQQGRRDELLLCLTAYDRLRNLEKQTE